MTAIEYLKTKNCIVYSDINYCTPSGIEYNIGFDRNKAIVAALMYDDDIYFIPKNELKEMSISAQYLGIKEISLHTNYGIELHSKYEKPELIGFNKIEKIIL